MLLWTHEASHYLLFRSRRFNDLWANLFLSSPVGISVATYRHTHVSHHGYLATEQDLDRPSFDRDIRGGWRLAFVLLRSLSGWDGLRLVWTKYATGGRQATRGKEGQSVASSFTVCWNLLLLTLCWFAGRWYLYLFLWAIPILSASVTLNIVRTLAEHLPAGSSGQALDGARIPVVRTTLPGTLEKWLLYQANFNYHVEHHLFPTVPAHNLPALHAHLVERGFYDRHPECLQRSGIKRVLEMSVTPDMPRGQRNAGFGADEAAGRGESSLRP